MIIRKAEVNDAENMFNMMLGLDNETKYMLLEPGERGNNPKRLKSMIEKSVNEDDLILIAEENKEIVGFLSAQRGGARKIKHSAYIVVGIREGFRGKGIGTSFFRGLDDWAKENSIVRLELTVMFPNKLAKHLYEKNGFEIEGIKKKSIFMDGKYIDEYYMAKIYE